MSKKLITKFLGDIFIYVSVVIFLGGVISCDSKPNKKVIPVEFGGEKVSVKIDTASIRIGEQLTYTIAVDETEKVIIPTPKLKNLEIVDSLKVDTISNSLVKKYKLTSFKEGAFYIPSQQVFIKNRAYLTDSLSVSVATVKIDTTKVKKFEIKGIKSEPYQYNDFSHYWWLVILIIGIIAFVLYWFVLRKKEEVVVQESQPKLPPYEEAILALKSLDKKLLWQNNKVKEYYSELTDILRTFIENEFSVAAMESTSDEIVKKLSRMHRKKEIIAPNESLNKLIRLLQISDLVKFAKSKPLADEIESDRKHAEHIVDSLKPKNKEEEHSIPLDKAK